MVVHWLPIYHHLKITWEQPEKDKLIITSGSTVMRLDFTDDSLVEYNIPSPYNDYVNKAWREQGELHLSILSRGRLGTKITIDHGEDKVLTWKTG